MSAIVEMCKSAREGSRVVATLSTAVKNEVLNELSRQIVLRHQEIERANRADVEAAKHAGVASAKIQRLALSEMSIYQLATGLQQVAALPDPVGQVVKDYRVESGLRVRRVRTPLGVVCMIYEARPGVTVDAFALCFKAGNACILKGGKEAAQSNALLASIVREVLEKHGVPAAAMCAMVSSDREEMTELLQQDQYVDLVIPRGGTELIRYVARTSRIPTIQHYQGVCHVFVDASADLEMALRVCVTAKTSAPATCNACECVLVHEGVAKEVVPRLVNAYRAARVEVRGDERVRALAPEASPATNEDWGREFLDLIVAMKVVRDMDEAIAHIARYGSNHTEAILTRDQANADAFCARVQSSCVVVNASTRFNDGFQLGLGAEIGISTTRLHAYGPMGLEELTTMRFVVSGDGQTR
jgi:glutamate-5-semialdehyde dehydrogenase